MKKQNFLFIDCSKAAHCCDKAQYKEAGRFEKLKLYIHFLFCEPCRNYAKKNTQLTKIIKDSKITTCKKEDKNYWKSEIKKEMTKTKSH